MRTYSRSCSRNQVIEDVLERCRLCLAKTTDKISIFKDITTKCALAVKIMMCVGYEISPKECLPKFICTKCFKDLNQYYEFKNKCAMTCQKLINHMEALKEKETQDIINTESKITDNQCKSSEEKRHRIASYEELVSETLSQTEHEIPVKIIPKIIPDPTDKYTENTQIEADDNILKAQESVIKCLPKQIVEERIPNPVERIPNPEERIPNPEECIPNPEERIPNPEERIPNPEERTPNPETEPPDMSGFLSSVLLEMKVLKKNSNDIRLRDSYLRTVDIETVDGTVLTYDINEIEEEIPVEEEHNKLKRAQPEDNVKKDESAATQAKALSLANCAQCGKTFASSSALRRHRRVHSGERPYVCSVCQRGFAQKEVLARHALVHMEQRPYKCKTCPKSFTQRSALEAHERSHAAPNQRPLAIHSCTKCSKVFLHGSGLSRHMMTHNGRMFECASCTRRFVDHSSLLRHMRIKHRTDGRLGNVIAPNASATPQQKDGLCT